MVVDEADCSVLAVSLCGDMHLEIAHELAALKPGLVVVSHSGFRDGLRGSLLHFLLDKCGLSVMVL